MVEPGKALILLASRPETVEVAVLRDLLQKRNRSILAHGLEPIDDKFALHFLEYEDALVEAPEARVGAEHVR
jgi:hypothetical protein